MGGFLKNLKWKQAAGRMLFFCLFFLSAFFKKGVETYAQGPGLSDSGDVYGSEAQVEIIESVPGEDTGFSMKFMYGFRNIAKSGRKLPFYVEITNNGTADTSARLVIEIPGSVEIERNGYEQADIIYSFDVELPAGSTADLRKTISVAAGSSQARLTLYDEYGNTLCAGETTIDLRSAESSEMLIGVLSDTPEKLAYFDGISIGGTSVRTRTVELDAADMPDTQAGLEQLDVLLISNYGTEELGSAQTAAIQSWVNSGGVLLVGTGGSVEAAEKLLGLADDSSIENPVLRSVNMGLKYSKADPDDAVIDLYVCSVYVPGATEAMQSDDIAMLTTVPSNNGIIGITAYDLCDISGFCAEEPEYTEEILTGLLGSSRLNQNGFANSTVELLRRSRSLVGTLDPGRLPSAFAYILIAAVYITLASFGIYWVLKSHGMSLYYLAACPIIAFMSAFAIWMVSFATRREGISMEYAAIRELGEDQVTDQGFIKLYSSSLSGFSTVLPEGYELHPIVSGGETPVPGRMGVSAQVISSVTGAEGSTSITFGEIGGRPTVSVSGIRPFAGIYTEYTAVSGYGSGAGEPVPCSINLYDGGISGYVANNTGYSLKDAALIMYGKVVLLGDMEPGGSFTLDGAQVIDCPIGDADAVAGFVSGLYGLDGEDASYYCTLKYERLLEYYMSDSLPGYFTGARLAAFVEDAGVPGGIEASGHIDVNGCMLVETSLPVTYEKDGHVWSNCMEREPELSSGEYDAATNTTSGSCVLEYTLGSSLNVESISFDGVDEDFRELGTIPFTGKVYVYNYADGAYRLVALNGGSITGDELTSCLSPGNTITVRYVSGGNLSQEGRISLPVPSVTGVKRE